MKKLMFAAVAALSASAFATIESSVVGYSSNNLRSGSIGLVPQFAGVASADGSFDLQTISCNDDSSDSVSFSVLNNIGIGGDSYYWIDWYDPDGDEIYESCWVDGGYEKVYGFTLQPGEALWVAGERDTQLFRSTGKVNTADVTVQLRSGSTLTGNPSPVALDLQDIYCNDDSSDSVSFSVLNNIGVGGDSYYWINWYDPDGDEIYESCWVDGAYEKVEGFTVNPGDGLWVAGERDTQYITFPGVEL